MAKEIELKFLLKKGTSIPIPEPFYKVRIKQGYIYAEKNKQVRIRITILPNLSIKSSIATLGIKYTGKLVRDEFEFPIDLIQAKELYNKCEWSLEKNRLSFDSNGVHYDVDSFPNGFVFVEVEFKSVKAIKKWIKPSWIGKEITGKSKYSNIVMAKKNLKF